METVIEICECHLVPLTVLAFFLASLGECLMEWAMESGWRRKNLKFINNDDITLLNDELESGYYNEYQIGKIIIDAYKKEKELKRIRKGWRKRLWDGFKNLKKK